jgi:hypothetical protein
MALPNRRSKSGTLGQPPGAVAVWLLPAHRDGHKAKRFGYDDPKFSRKALLWKTGRN